MQKTIGVRFQKAGKIIPYMPGQLELELGEKVIVDTARGMECGTVVTGEKEIDETKLEEPLRAISSDILLSNRPMHFYMICIALLKL